MPDRTGRPPVASRGSRLSCQAAGSLGPGTGASLGPSSLPSAPAAVSAAAPHGTAPPFTPVSLSHAWGRLVTKPSPCLVRTGRWAPDLCPYSHASSPPAASLQGGGEHSAPSSPLPGRRAGRRCGMSQTGVCLALGKKLCVKSWSRETSKLGGDYSYTHTHTYTRAHTQRSTVTNNRANAPDVPAL